MEFVTMAGDGNFVEIVAAVVADAEQQLRPKLIELVEVVAVDVDVDWPEIVETGSDEWSFEAQLRQHYG